MNSFSGNGSHRSPAPASGPSFDSYQFDFGIAGSGRGSGFRPLNDQKPNPYAPPSSSRPAATPAWSNQPSRPAWNPPAPAGSGNLANSPASMVGDIFGKSWTPTPAASSGIGIPKSDPNLFSDLVGSALGQGRGGSGNVPLKSSAPRNVFSMGNLSDSLPRSTTTTPTPAGAGSTPFRPSTGGSADKIGNFSAFTQPGPRIGTPMGGGGQPMKSAAGASSANHNRDPFGSLVDFGAKAPTKVSTPSANSSKASNGSVNVVTDDFSFGAFQNASSTTMGNTGIPEARFPSPPPPQQQNPLKSGTDPLDMFFSSSTAAAPAPAVASSEKPGSQQFSEMNDWDLGSEFGGHDSGGPTLEIEGLPPPPPGVTAAAAKSKGMDNYKQGQFADAIKWLSWAVVLLKKSGDSVLMADALSCRASCYKEVGEYKKAVADCSKVLEKDTKNVSILVQRALLYESMEKYKLGAEDLRMVLKIDPGNRVARSTIHRLSKFAD